MAAPTSTEITEKLALLKQHGRDYDAQRQRMMYAHGEEVNGAYQAMLEAEKKYLALSDWFIDQGIPVFWDCERQVYIALPAIQRWGKAP